MQHAFALVLITLLQLCRAQTPNALPEWYAANLINDTGFQPKPITDIFTTRATFSSRNPIIVASTPSTSVTDEVFVFATSPTSTRWTTEMNSSPSTEDATEKVLPLQDNPSTTTRSREEQRQIYQQQPQQIQVLLPQPFPIQPSQPQPNQLTTGQPNYFLIYQQAPLSIQQYPQSASQSRQSTQLPTQSTPQGTPGTQRTTPVAMQSTTVTQPQTFTTEVIKQEGTRSTTISTTQTTTLPSSTFTSVPRKVRQDPLLFLTSTSTPFSSTWQDPSTAPGPIYYSPPISSTIPPNSTWSPCLNVTATGRNPRSNITAAIPSTQRQNKIPALTIRVKAPRGSITNININPTSTTRKPSTRRSQRRKGNNYNNCVDSCRGKKEPICAAPLAVIPIDPNNLKGFPSICQLACHNSFRKNQPYEKIMDGRCSKLRTRIRTFDKNKLKRDELNKAQYTVLNNSPETVVQVIQNERSG